MRIVIKRKIVFKKIVAGLLLLLLLSNVCYASNVRVTKDTTTILLTINEKITSKTVCAGDVLDAKISENVYVDNQLIFKKGAPAKVNVTMVKKATIMGAPGEIILENGKIKDIKGDNHIITFARNFKGNAKLYPKVFTAVGIIVWPCLFFGLAKGGQAIVPANYEIEGTLRDDFDFVPQENILQIKETTGIN